jgi:hypothetical protein
MKKKIIAGLMSMMLVVAMAVPVSAEPNDRITVTYTQPNKYEIDIPLNIALQVGTENTVNITADEMNVAPNKRVSVEVASGITVTNPTIGGEVTLTRDGGSETTKSVVSLTSGGTGISVNEEVATFTNQNTSPATGGTLHFAGLANDLKAGAWSGQIVFSISVQ